MKIKLVVGVLAASLFAGGAAAQVRPPQTPPRGGHEPPPQAYADCKGKKAGDTVQHTTPEGTVAATCGETPRGLAARPIRPRAEQPAVRPK